MRIPLRGTGPALAIAHRGASAQAPENTLAAFELAWTGGARWVEADVQPTADSELVILHDPDLVRTTGLPGTVRELAAAALAELDAGSWFGPAFAGQRVPSLRQLLDVMPDRGHLLLEIKGEFTPEQIVRKLDTIEGHPAGDRVALQSFEIHVLETVAQLRPGVDLGVLREHLDEDPVALCSWLGASSYNPEYREFLENPAVIGPLHEAGIAVAVWTSDDPAEWEQLDALGVDAIITNDPVDLLRWQTSRAPGPIDGTAPARSTSDR